MTLIGFLFWFLFICWLLAKLDGAGRHTPAQPVYVQVTVINQNTQPTQVSQTPNYHTDSNLRRF